MATIYGVYSCGHKGSVRYYGSVKQNQWKADRHFSGLCPECQAIEDAKRLEEIRSEHANGEDALPMLTGTDKQIIWAEGIRKEHLAKISDEFERYVKNNKDTSVEAQNEIKILDCAIRRISAITSAGWWIDNRFSIISALRNYVREHHHDLAEEIMGVSPSSKQNNTGNVDNEENRDDRDNPECEAAPEEIKTPCVATIKITPDAVLLESPRDEIIRSVVRDFRMKWNRVNWEYKLSLTTGSGQDRAAELGNKLLNAGVTIKMPDVQTLRMAIEGSYQPRVDRWVMRNDSQSVFLEYPHDDNELYQRSRKLPGAKWESGRGMVVPATSVEEIIKFAQVMEFSITDKAQKLLDEALERKQNRATVKPSIPKNR